MSAYGETWSDATEKSLGVFVSAWCAYTRKKPISVYATGEGSAR